MRLPSRTAARDHACAVGVPRFISAPDVAVTRWHVGPVVDVAAYAFSWVWILIPLAMMGDAKADYLGVFIGVLIITDLHRHIGLPYVYLDSQVRSRHAVRFFVLPAVMFVLWFGAPYFKRFGPSLSVSAVLGALALVVVLIELMRRDVGDAPPWAALLKIGVPAACATALVFVVGGDARGPMWLGVAALSSWGLRRVWPSVVRSSNRTPWVLLGLGVVMGVTATTSLPALRPRDVISGVAVVAGAWNIWHVLMQKYGILRLYNAKSGNASKVPGWVDRLILFAWIPLFLVWVGPANRNAVLGAYRQGSKILVPILDTMTAVQPYLMAPSVALVIGALALFLRHEWRANGLRNAPRLWLAAGTTLLSLAFFFLHPLKVYVAYGFSHAVEYIVFVWAFQRRRYAAPLPHRPTLARILRRPGLAYGGFVVGGAVLIFVLQYYGRNVFAERDQPYFVGFSTAEWFVYWGMLQSMIHFYFDSFMWKMRHPSTRAHI